MASLYLTDFALKFAVRYFDLKVKATNEGADIKGYLDPSVIKSDSCLLTTGQTSA